MGGIGEINRSKSLAFKKGSRAFFMGIIIFTHEGGVI